MQNRSILDFTGIIKESLNEFSFEDKLEEVGIVVSVCDGVAKVYGLSNVYLGELIEFENNIMGIALNLNFDSVDVVIFGIDSDIKEGLTAKRTKKNVSVPVGRELLGRVVDPLGNPLDGKGPIKFAKFENVERNAPGILSRKSVHEPLQTGIKAIDSMIPIGRGQRELIIGDRQTGKTAIAIDTIINQCNINKLKAHDKEKVFSVYVVIGQKKSTIARIIKEFEDRGIIDDIIVVVTSASDPVSFQYLAPYSGCTMAEYFRDNGMHALVVYDDLSKHAVAYRQMSLLLRRPPSREAYPGDIFYLHSRLLERAAKLSDALGGGSLTALPIVETQANDISAYIPTNVISITDGQIFLDNSLFYKGSRPAIDIGLSVSRVGSSAQTKAIKSVASKLKQELAQYRELEAFSKFGSDLDDITLKVLDSGRKISMIMIQDQYKPLLVSEQVVLILPISKGLYQSVSLDSIKKIENDILNVFRTSYQDILQEIEVSGVLSKENEDKIYNIIKGIVDNYQPQ